MSVKIADVQDAWNLRFSCPDAVQSWLDGVQASDADQAPLLIIQSFLDWRRGHVRLALEGVEQARTVEDGVWRGRMLNLQAMLLVLYADQDREGAGNLEHALNLLQDQLAIGERLGDTELQALAFNDIGALIAWSAAGNAFGFYERAYHLIQDGHPGLIAIKGLAAANMASALHRSQAFDQAAPLIAEARALLLRSSATMLWPWYVNVQVVRDLHHGRAHDARRCVEDGLSRLATDPQRTDYSLHMLWYTAALLEAKLGRPREALEWLNRVRAATEFRDGAQLQVLDLKATVHAQLGEHQEAYETARLLMQVIWQHYQHERATLVSRAELRQVKAAAQAQSRAASQRVSELQHRLTEEQSVKGHYERLSVTDTLTGLWNRRQFDLDCQSLSEGDGLLMIDIDHFKQINDTYGHATGDRVLQAVATCIQGTLRQDDRAYRYGGEEFAVILPGAGRNNLLTIAERIREGVQRNAPPRTPVVTVSIGGGLFDVARPEHHVRQADEALYAAKHSGRNRVCVVGDVMS